MSTAGGSGHTRPKSRRRLRSPTSPRDAPVFGTSRVWTIRQHETEPRVKGQEQTRVSGKRRRQQELRFFATWLRENKYCTEAAHGGAATPTKHEPLTPQKTAEMPTTAATGKPVLATSRRGTSPRYTHSSQRATSMARGTDTTATLATCSRIRGSVLVSLARRSLARREPRSVAPRVW